MTTTWWTPKKNCPICRKYPLPYGRTTCRECDEQIDWVGKPTFVESPPGTIYLPDEPPSRRRTRRRDT